MFRELSSMFSAMQGSSEYSRARAPAMAAASLSRFGQLDRAGRAGHLDQRGVAQIRLQVFAALAERLGMAVNAADLRHRARAVKEEMHRQVELRHGLHVRRGKRIKRRIHDTFGRVLNRHHAVVGAARFDGAEHVSDRRLRLRDDARGRISQARPDAKKCLPAPCKRR